jgi:serine O-acetyltransferase
MNLLYKLVKARRLPMIGKLAYFMLVLLGCDIPPQVKIGKGFILNHYGFGVVIHPLTVIGNGVSIYSGVTIGRADAYRRVGSKFKGVIIEDDVILGTGAKIMCKEGFLRVGRGTILGANAVLLQSTGEYEVWAGIPAKCVRKAEAGGRL